ncbi:hypothetical protein V3H18_10800 [Methylocystis sp. 9N]|uniref:Uncharacterized protein n=1 Tax=Methylocystis borbori TaxID=3118750 RepID=A0ABU7XI04_9HYPH
MRKPSRDVQLDDIIAGQWIGVDSDALAIALKIHLALEAILIEMIRLFQPDDKIYKLSFPQKTEKLVQQGYILSADKSAFDRFNDFRNDFAHIFGHRVTLEYALALARDLEALGIDFSDSVGSYSEAEATEYYGGFFGVLEEIGWNILYHAAYNLRERGGRDIFEAETRDVEP